MLVQFGASGLSCDSLYLRNSQKEFLSPASHIVGLLQRHSGKGADIDSERTLVECRKEAAAEAEEDSQCHGKQGQNCAQSGFLVGNHPFERHIVNLLEPSHDCRVLARLVALVAAEKIAAKDRSQCQCYQSRCEKCCNKGDSERSEHTALHSCKEEKRHEADHDDEGGVQNRQTDLTGSIENDLDNGLALRLGEFAVLPEMLEDIFHIDDRVIDQRAYRNRHTADTHRIDSQSHKLQCQNRHDKRQRNGDE